MKYFLMVLFLWYSAAAFAGDTSVINLTIRGDTTVAPNYYKVNFSFRAKGYTPQSARKTIQKRIRRMDNLFRKNGINTAPLRTKDIFINKSQKYDARLKDWIFDGYAAIQQFTFSDTDFNKLSEILVILTDAEVSKIAGIHFSNTNEQEIKNRFYVKMVLRGKSRIMRISKALGYKFLKISKIDGNELRHFVYPALMAKSIRKSVKIMPADVKYSIEIRITGILEVR